MSGETSLEKTDLTRRFSSFLKNDAVNDQAHVLH